MPPRERPRVPTMRQAGSYIMIYGYMRIAGHKCLETGTHMTLYSLMYLAYSIFQNKADALLVILVLCLYVVHQLMRFGAVSPLFKAAFTVDLAVLVDHPQTHNLISIVNQLLNQPVQRQVGVVILIRTAQECTRSLCIGIVPVRILQGEREVRSIPIVKSVEGDSLLVGTERRSGQRHIYNTSAIYQTPSKVSTQIMPCIIPDKALGHQMAATLQ